MAGTQKGLVVVFGGSGFVGRHIVRRLAKDGFKLRVVMRRPNEALFLSLIHISEPTRQAEISYAVFCLKKKK